jgi:hypothetical protein
MSHIGVGVDSLKIVAVSIRVMANDLLYRLLKNFLSICIRTLEEAAGKMSLGVFVFS